jgi:hypothetical protein
MADAKKKRPAEKPRPVLSLPTAEESAAAIRAAAKHLGLLIDLHRIARSLRDVDPPPRSSS